MFFILIKEKVDFCNVAYWIQSFFWISIYIQKRIYHIDTLNSQAHLFEIKYRLKKWKININEGKSRHIILLNYDKYFGLYLGRKLTNNHIKLSKKVTKLWRNLSAWTGSWVEDPNCPIPTNDTSIQLY